MSGIDLAVMISLSDPRVSFRRPPQLTDEVSSARTPKGSPPGRPSEDRPDVQVPPACTGTPVCQVARPAAEPPSCLSGAADHYHVLYPFWYFLRLA